MTNDLTRDRAVQLLDLVACQAAELRAAVVAGTETRHRLVHWVGSVEAAVEIMLKVTASPCDDDQPRPGERRAPTSS